MDGQTHSSIIGLLDRQMDWQTITEWKKSKCEEGEERKKKAGRKRESRNAKEIFIKEEKTMKETDKQTEIEMKREKERMK